ncbi:hypothetical protein TRAPUB_11259 [Trametes pubescens]|uniref:Uncharacterized protein n=1 Tax=Trametes pubescens TaxID=154538 RepID=A0A1M2VXA1_TRAPU|nr:hypothetical protein TRAPUB_11259 [Trametes pubescens]
MNSRRGILEKGMAYDTGSFGLQFIDPQELRSERHELRTIRFRLPKSSREEGESPQNGSDDRIILDAKGPSDATFVDISANRDTERGSD